MKNIRCWGGLLKLSIKKSFFYNFSHLRIYLSRDFIPSKRIRSSICGVACSLFTLKPGYPRNWPNNTIEAMEIAVRFQWTSVKVGRGSARKIAVLVNNNHLVFWRFNYVISMSVKSIRNYSQTFEDLMHSRPFSRWHRVWVLIKLYLCVHCAAGISSTELPPPHIECTRTWW